jgi:hypothetical protein
MNEKMVKSMKKILYSSIACICLSFFSQSALAQHDERLSAKGRDCSISMYPNPTTSRLFIDLGQPTVTEPAVLIFDMLGWWISVESNPVSISSRSVLPRSQSPAGSPSIPDSPQDVFSLMAMPNSSS